MKKTVFLTGASGFIASHIAESYLENGYEVIGIDNFSTGYRENMDTFIDNENYTFYEADLLDMEKMEEIFNTHKIHIINHHVAQKSVPKSVVEPRLDNDLNIVAILNVIELAKKYQIEKVIAASSGGALSKEILFDGDKSTEEDMPQLTSPYAITKFSGEKYFEIYAREYGFDYIGLRYANAYGPRQAAEGDCGVIPIFVNNILANKTSFLSTYEDMPRGCSRDYIYVSDIADFNLRAANYEGQVNGAFNIGHGEELYILDIYEKLAKAFNSKAPIEIVGPRAGDMKRSVLDTTKAEETFGWKPTVSLDQGIEMLHESMMNK